MATERVLFWNLYNMFRGLDTAWTAQPDKSLAEKFNSDGGVTFESRVAHIAARLADFSGNPNGPAMLGVCEVEMAASTISALTFRLNEELATTYTAHYRQVRSNRAICTVLFTRWTVSETVALSPEWRVIRSRITSLSQPFYVYTCHWPSKVSDPDGEQRKLLAKIIYENIVSLGSGARAIVWGDLNDTPTDASIATYLKAGSSEAAATGSTHPSLILYNNMTAGHLSGQFTHHHRGVNSIIDHICCTGTLLGAVNPSLAPATTTIHTTGVTLSGKPWRFDADIPANPNQGYSDHYPISIELSWT